MSGHDGVGGALAQRPFLGILVFSTVETAVVAGWGAIIVEGMFTVLERALELPPNTLRLPLGVQLAAAAVLEVGYIIEHVIAFNVGKGRSLFSWPRP